MLNLAEPPLWWLLFVAERGAALGISLPMPAGATGAALAGALIGCGVAVLARLGSRRHRTHAGPAPPPAPGDGPVNLSPATRRIVP